MRSVLLTILAFTSSLHAAAWVTFAPVLIPRQEVAVAATSSKLYLIGGISGTTILSEVEEYDPATNRWRLVAPLPQPRHHTAAVALGDSLYVIGGYATISFVPQRNVYRYDIDLDRWTEVAPVPAARAALAAVAIDGKIYAVGGVPGDGRTLTVYDPATNAWTTLASMPTGREHLAAAAHDGMLYVAGGRLAGNSDAFKSYDPATNRWTMLPPLPTARSGIAAAVLGGRMYVFGGEGNSATATGVFEQNESFDFASGTWSTELPMPVPRHGIGAASLRGAIHIPAGAPVQGFGISDVHDAFLPKTARRRAVRQ